MPKSNQHNIAIDGNEANVTNRVGSNVYAFEMIRHLELLLRDHPNLQVTILLSQPPVDDLPVERTGFKYRVLQPNPLWTQLALPLHLLSHRPKYSVLYSPGHYTPHYCPVPTITSVMDLGFEVYPHFFTDKDAYKLKTWTRRSVKQAKKVVAISQFTKSEVARLYGKKSSQIVVAPPALSTLPTLSQAEIDKLLADLKIKHPYVLYVGTLQPRKNLLGVIRGFEELKSQLKSSNDRRLKSLSNLQLVLAGKVGWLADPILQAIKDSPQQASIHHLGYVTDQQKVALYSAAESSILIGWYEGFGIPPLESLAMGCVPVVAKGSSLPEVVDGAGVLVDPSSEKAIAEGWMSILSATPKQKAIWRSAAKKQLQLYNWQTSAQVVLDSFLELLTPSP